MKLPPDDALALRKALEPLTLPAIESDGNELAMTSIAISLKRIADAMPKTEPKVTFDSEGNLYVSHPAWDHGLKVIRGVVIIHQDDLRAAEHHGWQQMPRATTSREADLDLIRVMKL